VVGCFFPEENEKKAIFFLPPPEEEIYFPAEAGKNKLILSSKPHG
jgi:hypothetical protein